MGDDYSAQISGNTVSHNERKTNNKFSSTFSSYVTQFGYSVGMSDIWRFPFMTYRNGGGAFLIPFVTMIVVCGIPMYFLEFSVGKFSGRGPYQVWDICPLFRGVGITICLCYGIYMIGTSIFRCWILQFIFYSFQEPVPWSQCDREWNTPMCRGYRALNSTDTVTALPILSNTSYDVLSNMSGIANITIANASSGSSKDTMSAAEEFWQYKVLQLSSGILDFSPVIWRYFLFMFIIRLFICLCSIKSIKSIEKVVYVTATVPVILTVIIFIRSVMLPGSQLGIYYFFYPQFDKILKVRVWIEATLMAFYTLGFGWGAIIVLGSHADFKENCLRTAIILPVVDMSIAIFNGMVCFCVLGNMAHSNNVNITDVINAGMATGMVSYVTALSSLPVPQLWAGLFFVSMFLTGVEAQLVPFHMIIQAIGDLSKRTRSCSRMMTLLALTCVLFVLALPTCTGSGGYLFLWIDWYGGAWPGPIVAFIEVIVIAWIYGLDKFNEDVHMMIGRSIPGILRIGIAFVCPVAVAVIFFTSLVEYVPPKYGTYNYPTSSRIAGWLLVLIILMPIIVQGGHILIKSKGPYLTKAKTLLKPLGAWGPSEEAKQMEYNAIKSKYRNRTFKDLFYYNLFGKYRTSSAMSVVSNQEMNGMVDNSILQ